MLKENVGMRDIIAVFKARKRGIMTIFLVIFVSVFAGTFLIKPAYRANAEVYVDPGNDSSLKFQQQLTPIDNNAFLQTQLSVLKSEEIAYKVVKKLGLDRNNESTADASFIAKIWNRLKNRREQYLQKAKQEEALENFREKLGLDVEKNSNVINVSFEDPDPNVAANVVNTTVQTYMDQSLDMKVAPARESMNWLSGRLEEVKAKLNDTSASLQDFKREKDLVTADAKDANISIQSLKDLSTSVLAAEVKRRSAEAKYMRMKQLANEEAGLSSLPEVLNDPLIVSLKNQRAEIEKKMSNLSKLYGEKHPSMIRIKKEMESIDGQIKEETNNVRNAIKNEYYESMDAETSLKKAFEGQKRKAIDYERRSAEYYLKEDDVQSEKEMYNAILKKFQESNVLGSLDISNIYFLHRATPPLRPYKPNKTMNVGLGFFLALFASLSYAILSEKMDNTFKSPEEIENGLDLPVLGIVPRAELPAGNEGKGYTLAVARQHSTIAEAFRNIKGNMLLRADVNPRVIQVSSAMSSEGKSTVSISLATTLAMSGERVLLIDADMRRPSLHKILKLPNHKGLSTYLENRSKYDEIIYSTRTENLSVIPSGPVALNAAELISSGRMRECLSEAWDRYDRLIIDCPPYLGPPDAYLITPMVDSVILVVLSGKTGKEMLLRALKDLRAIKANMLGCVLNDANSRSQAYYGYYHYY